MTEASIEYPLAGLRVLELSTTPAGAICTMLLADQGAAVTLVEPTEGSPLRALPVSRVWLRGKRSVLIGSYDGAAQIAGLAAAADVVVLGSADGAVSRHLSDAESAASLIVCHVGGPLGPFPADDDLIAAITGIMGRQPGFRAGPTYVMQDLSTYACAVIAVEAIGAALYARERTGLGDRIDVPLLAGSLQHQGAQLAETERPQPLQVLRRNAYGQLPLYRLYQCQDGRWLHLGLINARFWPRFCVAIDRPELISDPRFDTPVRFTSHESRRALMDILADVFATKSYAEWDRIFDEADVPCAPACTTDEFARDPQVVARGGGVVVDGYDGPERQPGLALHFAGGPLAPRGPLPLVGEHTANPWGAANPAVPPTVRPVAQTPATEQGRAASGPLEGVRLLDLSGYIAGPLGPAMLADLGADVIKVEGPDGDGLRGAHAGYLSWNRGKRGICVDLKTDAGRGVVHRLAETADVVVENMRPGVAERLGVGYAALAAINPRLIYCYVSAYGSTGPYRHKPGVDPLMQARSGIERAEGGHEHPPVFLLVAVTDNTCAMLNAAGIALALYRREHTGRGCYLETSLLQAAALVQSDALLDYPNRPRPHVNDYEQSGPGPIRRLYRCNDGWLFLAADPSTGPAAGAESWSSLCRVLELDAITSDPRFATHEARAAHPQDLLDELLPAFARLPLDEALQRLHVAGVPAVEAIDAFQPRFHQALSAVGDDLIATTEHPLLGRVVTPGVAARFRRNPGRVQRAAPLLGEHTEAVLAKAGYSVSDIASLRALGAVGWGTMR